MSRFDLIVVGGGCMGASAVLASSKRQRYAKVLWVTGTKERTASNDFMKIIRDVYIDDLTSKYANGALRAWQEIEFFKAHYHKTGWVRVIGKNATMIKTADDALLPTEDFVVRTGSSPRLDEGEKLYLNQDVGYADSARAVAAVVSLMSAVQGVKVLKEDVTRILVEDEKCVGVEVGASRYLAEHTIVAAGVWTPRLLQDANISVPPGLMKVTAVAVAVLRLTDDEYEKLRNMPILVTEIGEVMLSHHEKALKMTTTNTFELETPDQLPQADVGANRQVLEKLLPQFAGRLLESFTCPDLLTPNQNPVVDRVPGAKDLYLVAGGSYHGFKFLPIFGNMVMRSAPAAP